MDKDKEPMELMKRSVIQVPKECLLGLVRRLSKQLSGPGLSSLFSHILSNSIFICGRLLHLSTYVLQVRA